MTLEGRARDADRGVQPLEALREGPRRLLVQLSTGPAHGLQALARHRKARLELTDLLFLCGIAMLRRLSAQVIDLGGHPGHVRQEEVLGQRKPRANPPGTIGRMNDPVYDPFWATCQEMGVPVAFHPGVHIDTPGACAKFQLVMESPNQSIT